MIEPVQYRFKYTSMYIAQLNRLARRFDERATECFVKVLKFGAYNLLVDGPFLLIWTGISNDGCCLVPERSKVSSVTLRNYLQVMGSTYAPKYLQSSGTVLSCLLGLAELCVILNGRGPRSLSVDVGDSGSLLEQCNIVPKLCQSSQRYQRCEEVTVVLRSA